MDPLEKIKKLKPKPRAKKRVEFKLRINLWKVLIATFLVKFFLPFLASAFEFQRMETRLDTSQALLDIKEGKIKEVLVQDSKLVLTYKDASTKVATKENNESYAELLEKAGMETTIVPYTVADWAERFRDSAAIKGDEGVSGNWQVHSLRMGTRQAHYFCNG